MASRPTNRTFGFVLSALFLAMAAIAWLAFGHIAVWLPVLAVVVGSVALVAPGILLPLNLFWHWLSRKLGTINNYLLLGAFYCFVVFPIGLIFHLFRYDPLNRRPVQGGGDYWIPVQRQQNRDTLHDQF